MPSNNAIYTPESSPDLQKARREGKRVLDLRDDGKWHDISVAGGPGKGDRDRTADKRRYDENFDRIFKQDPEKSGCAGDGTQDGGEKC
jgi:hypothetical protein